MSDPRNDRLRRSRRELSGCGIALMGIVGAILLLPGICALIMVGFDLAESWRNPTLALMLLVVSACGVALIWEAIRWRRGR